MWRTPLIALVAVGAVVVGGLGIRALLDGPTPLITEQCTVFDGTDTYRLQPEQAANAATISAIAVQRGLPARAASIGLATALQESKLRNIEHGDLDSLGLFQQRPSQGWGSEEQILDPVYATSAFYNHLAAIPNYQDLPITVAAQRVQLSAYPDAYAQHEPVAKSFASALTGHSQGALQCTLRPADASGSPESVAREAAAVFGELPMQTEPATTVITASGPTGHAVAAWAVATASRQHIVAVEHAGQRWDRESGEWAPGGHAGDDVVRIIVAQT